MISFRDRSPYVVGAVSIAVIGVLVTLAFMVGLLHLFERTYAVRAVFSDAAGVRDGDDVRVAGVKVGRVDSVEADRQRGAVVVGLVVNRGIRLGPETRATIALETLLGTKYVRLSGPVAAPYLHDLPSNERTIPLERTSTPFDVFELTKAGTRAVQATDTERLNRFVTQLADVTEDKGEAVGQLIEGLARMSQALAERDVQLRSLLERSATLTRTLAEKDQTLVGLLDQSAAVLDIIDRHRAQIGRGLEGGAQLSEQLSGIVAAHKSQIDLILETLHPTVDILDRRQADVDRTLAWIGSGTLGLARAGGNGPWQDVFVRHIGPDLVSLVASLRGERR